MKKFLAMLLCLSMLVCMVPLVATAEETTPSGTAINNENGLSAITGSGDFYLTEDIYVDISNLNSALIADGFSGTLDGNGHSILFKSSTNEAKNKPASTSLEGIIFKVCKAKKIKNLTIGSLDAIPTVTSSAANFGILAKEITGAATVFENVTVYGDITTTRVGANNVALFAAKTAHQVKFYNCKAIGSITTGVANKDVKYFGGFIGRFVPVAAAKMTLTVNDSLSMVEITGTKTNFVGFNSTYAGGFLGGISEGENDNTKRIADAFSISNSISYYVPQLYSDGANLVNNRGAFYGGVSGANALLSGTTTFTVTDCMTLDTLVTDLSFATANDASVRFNAPTGIRFYNTISAKAFDTLVNAFGEDNVTMGTIIAPAILVQNAGAFTKEALDNLNSQSPTYLDVAFGGEWFETENGTNTYVGSIVNILEDNYDLGYCGIGYITFNDGTGTKTVYANYGEQGIPAFTVRSLAEAVMADPNASEAEKAAVAKYLGTSEQ